MDAISVKEILTTVVLVAIIMLIYYMSYSEKRKQDKKIKEKLQFYLLFSL